jgi:hypothetical protein
LNPALTEDDSPNGYFLDADWDQVGPIVTAFAGKEIIPPMSVLATPRLSIPIVIETAPDAQDSADWIKETLAANGFTNISTSAADAPVDASSVAVPQTDLATGYLVAGLIGLGYDSVLPADSPRSPDELVITLAA